MVGIEIPDIALPNALHETTQIAFVSRFHQEMNMVGHEHGCMEPYPALLFGHEQTLAKDLIGLRSMKDRLPIIAALDDVMWGRR